MFLVLFSDSFFLTGFFDVVLEVFVICWTKK